MKRLLLTTVLALMAVAAFGQIRPYHEVVREVRSRISAYGPYDKDSTKLKKLLPPKEMAKKKEEIRQSQWPYGRARVFVDWSHHVDIYASEDPDNAGEILVYYYIPNFRDTRADSTFVVMGKAECEQMIASLKKADVVLREWARYAKKNRLDTFSETIGVEFPEVDIYWKKTRPPHGVQFYFSYYVWAGKQKWFDGMKGIAASDGSGALEANLLLPDFTMDEDYPVNIVLTVIEREYMVKYLNYEKLKKSFYGR